MRWQSRRPRLTFAIACITGCTPEAASGFGTEHYAGAGADPPSEVRTGTIATAAGPVEIEYVVIDGNAIFEGDIVVPWSDFLDPHAPRAASITYDRKWPNGVVPFVIDAALPNPQRVTDAIAHWQAQTPLRFVSRTTEAVYVQFVDGSGCSSPVGRTNGPQAVTLNSACSTGNAIHEIGHAIGLWHEQSRQDRDNHVIINWQNIEPGKEHNFNKYTTGMDLGAYDFDSIMHYGSYAFSANGLPTIVRRDGGLIAGQRVGLSPGDVSGAGTLYRYKNADLAAAWNDGGYASVAVYPSMGASFGPYTQWLVRQGGWANNIHWLAGDFNGDRLDDLAAIWNDGGYNTITIRQSTGSTFTIHHGAIRQGGWMESTQWLAGDYNGDGRTDLAAAWNDAGAVSVAVYLSTGTAFAPYSQWQVRQGGWIDTARWTSGDFNGDGRTDLAAIWNDGGYNTLTVRQSTGGSFASAHWAIRQGGWLLSTKWQSGDFNGDGRADLAAAWNDGGYVSVAVYPSTGASFGWYSQWQLRQGGWIDAAKWTAGDFNGDGRTDLAAVWNDGGYNTLTVRQSTGSSFASSHWAIRQGGWLDSTKWVAGRFR